MYLLDTNVVSELRKVAQGRANPQVVAWANSVLATQLFISAITVLELELGVGLIERRDARQGTLLRRWLEEQVLPAFDGRVLPVDAAVAQRCAGLHIPNPQPDRDALIAATAAVHGLTLVTRNTADFAATGVKWLNPWDTADGAT